MTDEQIKQNADEYANEHMVRTDGGGWEEEYDYEEQKAAYIAGAHSRDEEIKVMSKAIKSRDRLIRDYNKSMRAIIDYKGPSPWHPYPAEKPPQIRPEISARVIAHVPWGGVLHGFL